MSENFKYILVEEGAKVDRLIIQFTSGGLAINFNHGDSAEKIIGKLELAIEKIKKANIEGWKDSHE